MCSVINIRCNPHIICHSFKKKLDIIDLQCCNYCHLLRDSSSNFQSIMIIVHYIILKVHDMPKVDELKVILDDNICKLIHKSFH